MTRIAALVGPTGAGKTGLAVALAARVPLEVISCDSQAVYRGMDVGTAKPSPAERAGVPHHLIDVADPAEELTAARFAQLADAAIADVTSRGRLPLVVGGTGLWLRALLRGLVEAPPRDPAVRAELEARVAAEGAPALHRELARVDPGAAARIQPGDPVRIVRALEVFRLAGVPLSELQLRHAGGAPRYEATVLGVNPPREELHARVNERASSMFARGLEAEAAELARDPAVRARLERVMGYREALLLAGGAIDRDEALRRTAQEQRRYARRQLTWFRAMPEVVWLPWPPDPDAAARLLA
jgi:tRNA dimethylallyltransferase